MNHQLSLVEKQNKYKIKINAILEQGGSNTSQTNQHGTQSRLRDFRAGFPSFAVNHLSHSINQIDRRKFVVAWARTTKIASDIRDRRFTSYWNRLIRFCQTEAVPLARHFAIPFQAEGSIDLVSIWWEEEWHEWKQHASSYILLRYLKMGWTKSQNQRFSHILVLLREIEAAWETFAYIFSTSAGGFGEKYETTHLHFYKDVWHEPNGWWATTKCHATGFHDSFTITNI